MRGDEETIQDLDGIDLDRIADAALRSYADPGRIPAARGTAAKLLAQAREEAGGRRAAWRRMPVWAAAAVCVLAVLLAGAVWRMRAPERPAIAWAPPAPGVAPEAVPPSAAAHGRSGMTRVRAFRPRVHAQERPLPKLAVFPAPQRLTMQERALLAFATDGPPEVQRAVLHDQQHWDDPLIVADVRNQPPGAAGRRNR